jgi:UDP-N-acetylmuramate--alanine ligase
LELSTSARDAGEHAPEPPAIEDLDAVKGSVHFIGIGGIGMSALARLLLARGVKVSGSDKEESAIVAELRQLGAEVKIGHEAKNIEGAGLIAVSTAITDANPELAAGRVRKLPVLHRSDVLRLLAAKKKTLAVSGTHGKTTTTGMLAQVFMDAGLDPDVVVGGIFQRIGSNSHAGKGEFFIAEADESDRTHAEMQSYISLVTNIEPDHLENYPGGMAEICANMVSFINHSHHSVVLCADDAGCRSIAAEVKLPIIWYGTVNAATKADFTYESIESGMRVFKGGKLLGDIHLRVPGEHNKLNALAAVAAAAQCAVPFPAIADALSKFEGVARRFQLLGTKSGITLVDDYGHHPTEVRATLQAARQYQNQHAEVKRVVVLFQPHQPGRLRDLWNEFREAFADADLVLMADIYVARGGPIEGITSERFAGEVKHCNVKHLSGKAAELPPKVLPLLQSGDLILTVGAGDITAVGPELLKLI